VEIKRGPSEGIPELGWAIYRYVLSLTAEKGLTDESARRPRAEAVFSSMEEDSLALVTDLLKVSHVTQAEVVDNLASIEFLDRAVPMCKAQEARLEQAEASMLRAIKEQINEEWEAVQAAAEARRQAQRTSQTPSFVTPSVVP
jgi:hypothetical protein